MITCRRQIKNSTVLLDLFSISFNDKTGYSISKVMIIQLIVQY
jgi:hypothetical protein